MRAVVQRVVKAEVKVEDKVTGSIEAGLLVYLGIAKGDSEAEVEWMVEKVANLRVFCDDDGKMNLSLLDLIKRGEKAGLLAISQFTLLGDVKKGRRPYFGEAADPVKAKPLYEYFIKKISECGIDCQSGIFQAKMNVTYTNEGPVTLLLDTAI